LLDQAPAAPPATTSASMVTGVAESSVKVLVPTVVKLCTA
jgi:hypothetical protein